MKDYMLQVKRFYVTFFLFHSLSKTIMKSIGSVISRYANALYEASKATEALEVVENEFSLVTGVLYEMGADGTLFLNDALPMRIKEALWQHMFQSAKLSSIMQRFISLLLSNNRIGLLRVIHAKFSEIKLKESGMKCVEITTSYTLTEEMRDRMRKELEKCLSTKIFLREMVDSSILGGVIIKYDSCMVDGSIKSKLQLVKQKLLS